MADNLYLGLDLSLSCPAFAVIGVKAGKPYLVEKSHVKTSSKQWHGVRLLKIEAELQRYLLKYDFDAIAREKGFSRHNTTTQALFKVVGVSDLTVARGNGTPIVDIAPTTVKRVIAGNGKASKDEVADGVSALLEDNSVTFTTDDESDACAVALTYLIEKGVIK